MESAFINGIGNLLRENGFGYTESGGRFIVRDKNLMIVPVLTDDFDSEGNLKPQDSLNRKDPQDYSPGPKNLHDLLNTDNLLNAQAQQRPLAPRNSLPGTPIEAMRESRNAEQSADGIRRIFVYEDRWNSARENTKWKILGNLGKAKSIFARKCTVLSNFAKGAENRVSREKVGEFLEKYHNYGYVKSPYCIALSCNGSIVAAATFSEPKRFVNSGATVLSYEWTRYASLPEIRVAGGMGKILKYFIGHCRATLDSAGKEGAPSSESEKYYSATGNLNPDDTGGAARRDPGEIENRERYTIEIMSYSDNESGDGGVYRKLCFREAEGKTPIRYYVDKRDWRRLSARQVSALIKNGEFRGENFFPISNMGSRKFILRT